MKKIVALASVTALALGLAACGSPADEAVEEQAEGMEYQAEPTEPMENAGKIDDEADDEMGVVDLEDAGEGDTTP